MFCAHGKAHPIKEDDLRLLSVINITVPPDASVTTYSQIHHLDTNRIIKAQPTSRKLLRDNSGLVYIDSTGAIAYGRLLNLIVIQKPDVCKSQAYAVINCFHSLADVRSLSKNSSCRLDDHIVPLQFCRLASDYVCYVNLLLASTISLF